MKLVRQALLSALAALLLTASLAQDRPRIPANSKVYIAPNRGFETFLKVAFQKKQVPLVIVEDRTEADYELSSTFKSEQASTSKKIILGNWHSAEEASISVTDLKREVVVYAYSVHKGSSAHGKRSTAEACAKHLKNAILGKG